MAEKWAKRFVWTALPHSAIGAILSILFVFPPGGEGKDLSRMIAGGSVGTWVFVGYATYILVGFVGLSAWGFIYYISGEVNDWLSWVHLISHNIGVIASLLIFIAGIQGGTLGLEGRSAEIHNAIVWSVEPSGILIGLLIIGTIVGLVNVIIPSLKKG